MGSETTGRDAEGVQDGVDGCNHRYVREKGKTWDLETRKI